MRRSYLLFKTGHKCPLSPLLQGFNILPLLQGSLPRGFSLGPSRDHTGLGVSVSPVWEHLEGQAWSGSSALPNTKEPASLLSPQQPSQILRPCPPPPRLRCPSSDSGCRQDVGRGGSSSSSLSTSPLTAIKASLGTLTACRSGPDRSLGYFPICWKPGGKQMYANLGWPVARGAGPLEFPHPIRKPCLG